MSLQECPQQAKFFYKQFNVCHDLTAQASLLTDLPVMLQYKYKRSRICITMCQKYFRSCDRPGFQVELWLRTLCKSGRKNHKTNPPIFKRGKKNQSFYITNKQNILAYKIEYVSVFHLFKKLHFTTLPKYQSYIFKFYFSEYFFLNPKILVRVLN